MRVLAAAVGHRSGWERCGRVPPVSPQRSHYIMRKLQSVRMTFLAILLSAGLPQGLLADPIDDYVNAEIARQSVPGLSLAVVRNGKLVRANGYGLANIEHHVPVRPDTLFKTGAVGMQFTAVAVMQLVDDGRFRLDDPIRKYLPDAPLSWAPITIRNLLNHTSGLPATPNGNFRTEYTDDELLGIIYKLDLNYSAGSRWRFSYCNYIVLGFLIKKVTGEYYADFLTKRLFRPLNMHTAQPIDDQAIILNRAAGYEVREGKPRNAPWISATANSTADGSLYLSALDYAAWGAASLGRNAVKPESWAEITRPARLMSGRTYPHGFGWFQGQSAGQEIWYHSGSWQGFQAYIIHYLGDDLTLVAVANGENGDPAKIVGHVATMLDPKYTQLPGSPIGDHESKVTEGVKSLLQQIADDKVASDNFAYFAKRDFNSMMARYRRQLISLGPLREFALFARQDRGDDRVYHYRARYEEGTVEISVAYAPNGKIGNFEITPIHSWSAAVQL